MILLFHVQHFTKYGPDYQLDVLSGNRANKNSTDYISQLMHTIHGHLSAIVVGNSN